MPRLVFISDTHGTRPELPEGDILCHSGDFTVAGGALQATEFFRWFSSQPHPHKVFIAGNHDWCMQDYPASMATLLERYPQITYLRDSETTVGGLRIYGSPWQPTFHDWAFNLPRNGPEITERWRAIPEGVDVLLTHGPAYGTLDRVQQAGGIHVGCSVLRQELKRIRPKIHAFGHIHEGYGIVERDGLINVNAAICDLGGFWVAHDPITVDI